MTYLKDNKKEFNDCTVFLISKPGQSFTILIDVIGFLCVGFLES